MVTFVIASDNEAISGDCFGAYASRNDSLVVCYTMPDQDKILLAHGSGGRLMHRLIERVILGAYSNPILARLDDAACLELGNLRLAFTTDSYVVSPIFFPGGDIGRLAVTGTVNDLAMVGATPLYLSLALVIEEGFPVEDLRRILSSIADSAAEAKVQVVTGDTKVVGRGQVDRLFVNTAGIGIIPPGVDPSGGNLQPGDKLILSGSIGEHGLAIMAQRHQLPFDPPLRSDVAPLNHLVEGMLNSGAGLRALRDPTRGGLATTLAEWAKQSQVGLQLEEEAVPVQPQVRAACELLGLDPLYLACEGRLVAAVAPEDADTLLGAMREHPCGRGACLVGEVLPGDKGSPPSGLVQLKTRIGGRRILDMLTGEPLPRIC